MGVIGVYDADFFHYKNILPNLECAKLCAYYKKNKEIAVLTPEMAPERFSSLFIRKDYDDGIFPKEYFQSDIIIGGRALSKGDYKPLEEKIEKTIPDFSVYKDYSSYFAERKRDEALFQRVLGCAHIRLSTNGKDIDNWLTKEKLLYQGTRGIILHDYDISKINGAYDFIKDWSYSRKKIESGDLYPYPIGTKFPIQVNNEEELLKWSDLPMIKDLFLVQYNGLMEDKTCNRIAEEKGKNAPEIFYKVDDGCSSENDFLSNRLPKIIPQLLFFHKYGMKISLIYDDNIITTPQLQKLFLILNGFVSPKFKVERDDPIICYCKWLSKRTSPEKITYQKFLPISFSVADAREAFMYIRQKNYDVFKMFYELEKVKFDGRNIVDDSYRNSQSH